MIGKLAGALVGRDRVARKHRCREEQAMLRQVTFDKHIESNALCRGGVKGGNAMKGGSSVL